MQDLITRLLIRFQNLGRRSKTLLALAFILLMANLDALTDLVLHPEIDYFDHEHLIVGSITALISTLFLIIIMNYLDLVKDRLHERERSEAALQNAIARTQEEKNRSEAIIAAIGDGISIQDRDYRILYQNKVHRDFSGDHVGEFCYQAYEQNGQVCDACPVARTFKDGGIHTVERTVKRDGELFSYEITTSPLRDADGTIVAGIEAVRDVTARNRTAAALLQNEERYKKLSQEFHALLDAIPDNLTLQAPDLTVLWANRGAAAGLGLPQENLIGRRCYELWHGRTEPCEPCPVLRSFRTGKEENLITATPDNRLWDLRTFPLKSDAGDVTSVIEVGRDITAHRKLERQLIQAQKMEAVGLLAGGIAHDFNNILTAIMGYGSLVLGKMRPDDQLRVYIEHVLESSRRAADLTRGLLAFSRRQIINPQPVEMNDIIGRIEQLLLRIIGEDIELRVVLVEQATTVVADPGQIEQVFMNLATNARDAMPQGGRLTIETGTAQMDEAYITAHGYGKQGAYALVAVSDTGEGMDAKTREHVFEPFFTTKEIGKGTGLGLAIVYGIMKQHEGFVNCYSEPGHGTTFKIYLPLAGRKQELPPAAAVEDAPGGTETVLLAEDDAAVRKLSATVLKEGGYTVIEAVDGEDALERFTENQDRIELIILDVIMPKRNGRAVFEEAQRLRPGVKALFTSGYTADMIHRKGVLDRNLEFISKPAAPQEFLRAVRRALERK